MDRRSKHDWGAISEFIRRFWKDHYRAPSYQDIMDKFKISSKAVVSNIIHNLPGVDIIDGHSVPEGIRKAIEKAKE